MRTLHQYGGWFAVVLNGLVGVWGLVIHRREKSPGRAFWVGVGAALAALVFQVALGVYLVAARDGRGGDQHVFYGIVIAFVLAFAYIYRAQLAHRPAFRYGLFLLFMMGLSWRAIATFGADF
jgi:drug/metabolite transporter (DMT)-like permease